MSWSLFKVTAVDVKPVVAELRRVADAMEAYMRIEHNYHLTPPKPLGPDTGEDATVAYANDESTALRELREEYERSEGKHVEDDEEEDNT